MKVLEGLHEAGYASHLVGGCVRDLLLGREPTDFDVATDAEPEDVRRLFRNARLIGRRFRLAHVRFRREIVEVATFRGEADEESAPPPAGRATRNWRNNVYGSRDDDAWRRDITVNGLYWDFASGDIIDYVGGMEDLRAGVIRTIGDPDQRFSEDAVRMLRAVRFAASLGFRLDAGAGAAMARHAALLADVPPARMFEEVLKLLQRGYGLETFEMLRHHGLFGYLFPFTEEALQREVDGFPRILVPRALASTDERIGQGKPVIAAFLFAALLWDPVRSRAAAGGGDVTGVAAIDAAAAEVVREQGRFVSLPRRVTAPMREIWLLQPRLEERRPRWVRQLLQHRRFRAAYDFLLLRGEAGEVDDELCRWWTRIQDQESDEVERMLGEVSGGSSGTGRRRGRRRRGGRRRGGSSAAARGGGGSRDGGNG